MDERTDRGTEARGWTGPSGSSEVDAGDFGDWLVDINTAIDQGSEMTVPCGSCAACCSAAQFIHIAPDERKTLARIPKELLFPAPRMPKGHVLLGYDEHGRCPMFTGGACSIYEHRPKACRTYDCRVFAAADVFPEEPEKSAVAARARRWRFSHSGPDAVAAHESVRATARRLRAERSPEVPGTATAIVVTAVQIAARTTG
jgi:Fe-S-cluster containining protein